MGVTAGARTFTPPPPPPLKKKNNVNANKIKEGMYICLYCGYATGSNYEPICACITVYSYNSWGEPRTLPKFEFKDNEIKARVYKKKIRYNATDSKLKLK